MDIVGDLCGSSLWTNEKHVNYLNWMEDSFVRRTLLENDGGRCCSKLTYASSSSTTIDDVDDDNDLLLAPLDRFLPDSSDSTLDLKHQKNISSKITYPGTEISVTKKKMKKTCLSSQPQDEVSKDQVVPQLANVTDDGHDIMERETHLMSKLKSPLQLQRKKKKKQQQQQKNNKQQTTTIAMMKEEL